MQIEGRSVSVNPRISQGTSYFTRYRQLIQSSVDAGSIADDAGFFCKSSFGSHHRIGTVGDASSHTPRIYVCADESDVFQNLSIILPHTARWCCYSTPVRVASMASGFDN